MSRKYLTTIQKKQCFVELLIQEFPLVPVLIDLFLNSFLGLCAMGFQIASIVLKTDLYFIGCGHRIWVGFFALLTELFSSKLVFNRNIGFFTVTCVLKIISFLISTALIVIPALIFRHNLAQCTEVYCQNAWINYVLLGIGIAMKIESLIFWLAFGIKYKLFSRKFNYNNYYIKY
ncbi:hypothetical protein BpHYR1_037592 [Brachionus plicatilis]|uniref:Uncharacterized protein n=1 Tax=Brachionus plicatilis TaxID=10195 RepID=A0A3M7SC27_BRAPC|nr:hypothetical protein BpHYR1_037592 [Brachionus plicatilis]